MFLDSETVDESRQPLTIFRLRTLEKAQHNTDYYVKELLVPVFQDGNVWRK